MQLSPIRPLRYEKKSHEPSRRVIRRAQSVWANKSKAVADAGIVLCVKEEAVAGEDVNKKWSRGDFLSFAN